VAGLHSPDSYISVARWLDAGHLLAMASIPEQAQPGGDYDEPFAGFGPVIIDIGTGEVHVIRDASPGALLYSQRDILAAPPGPFVKATADPCLNIRSEPSTGASVLECVANGVLLFDHLHGDKVAAATPIDGWMSVGAPDGKNGYASTDFLEIPAY
jgi:hypothetical protein